MPELILIEIAAALAGKVAESLYELVRGKFKDRKPALAALDAAQGAPPDSSQVIALAEELAVAEDYDDDFRDRLRGEWAAIQASGGSASNTITGQVTGNVVQARDIQGNITFGS